ncbi:MAG: hypothetical protein J6T18_02100 [Bacteroidaceae bacterium]|nr:hypothetical protein [Bacteroidaceae bacterium]
MDNIERKYLENMSAGVVLSSPSENGPYTSSIHCFYYAVLLFMKHRLAHVDHAISYTEQEERAKTSQEGGSHDYIINELANRMITSDKNVRVFKQDIRSLKQKRVLADYGEMIFSQEESLECRAQAEGLINDIKRYTRIAV